MKNRKQFYGAIGSVSSGTMLAEDLIPSFLSECHRLRLTKDEYKTVREIERDSNKEGYFETEQASDDLDELFNILDNHSLPYFSFGSHPGDGADFGWWLSEWFPFDGLNVGDTSEVPEEYRGEVLVVNDHGNMSLYVKTSKTKFREIWAVV